MNFSDVLASSIHDIKNALNMVINTLDELMSDPVTGLAKNPKARRLEWEVQRANNDLVQLLTVYKSENRQLSVHIAEIALDEFLDDVTVEIRGSLEARGISIETRCDPSVVGYFDEDMVRGVIGNAVNNAQRYTRDRILLSAEERDGHVVIRVEDNGSGYPESMLQQRNTSDAGNSFIAGHTQLGLYFSDLIARMHNNRGKTGFVRMENQVNLEGGCFSLWLP